MSPVAEALGLSRARLLIHCWTSRRGDRGDRRAPERWQDVQPQVRFVPGRGARPLGRLFGGQPVHRLGQERRGRPAPLAARLGPAGLDAGVERDCIALGGEHPGMLDPPVITPPDQVVEPAVRRRGRPLCAVLIRPCGQHWRLALSHCAN